jgi:glyoxylase-like metal-dependent hydrolase (beta-lactamase superfamily II)/rhodanese-related sulfurtransferase
VYFKQFLHDDLGCSSYFVASRESREAAVIDPQLDIAPYIDLAEERGYTITRVIDTHLHADHVSGNRLLAAATGAHLHLHEAADVLFPFEPLKDGETVPLGQLQLQVIHTPGHRPEMISLLIINPERSPEPSMVLTGDALFVGDVGRPDFGGPEGAEQEYQSIQRLLALPDYVEVFPAHFEGSCGKGMCGRPSTTIGFERRFNPVVQLPRDAFVQATAEVPARPLNMTAIMDANRGVADYPFGPVGHDVEVVEVAAGEGPAWLAAHPGARVIDVREDEEYAAGHLPGATLIPQADLATRLPGLPRDADLLVVCAGGVRSRRATGFLRGAGFDRAVSLEGGTDAWREAGRPIER